MINELHFHFVKKLIFFCCHWHLTQSEIESNFSITSLHFFHSPSIFILLQLNATADDCVSQAIVGNDAAKVLECIEKAYDNAINTINNDLVKLGNDLTTVQHSGDATIAATNAILILIESQIPSK